MSERSQELFLLDIIESIDAIQSFITNTGRAPIFWNGMLVSALVALVIFFFGLRYFRNMERNFADVIE